MNLYEHTIIARQDTGPTQLNQLKEKYSKIVEKNQGDIVKYLNRFLSVFSFFSNSEIVSLLALILKWI